MKGGVYRMLTLLPERAFHAAERILRQAFQLRRLTDKGRQSYWAAFIPTIPFLWHTVPTCRSFSTRLFPPMKQGRRSVPLSALQSKVRKAVPEHRQSDSCRSMPELRQMSKQHGIPLCKTSCRILLWHIPPLIRIFSFRAGSVMGKR